MKFFDRMSSNMYVYEIEKISYIKMVRLRSFCVDAYKHTQKHNWHNGAGALCIPVTRVIVVCTHHLTHWVGAH